MKELYSQPIYNKKGYDIFENFSFLRNTRRRSAYVIKESNKPEFTLDYVNSSSCMGKSNSKGFITIEKTKILYQSSMHMPF